MENVVIDSLGVVSGVLECSSCNSSFRVEDGVFHLAWNVHDQVGNYGEEWRAEEFESLIPNDGTSYETHAEWLERKLGYSPRVAKLVSEYESKFTKGRMMEMLTVKDGDVVMDLGCGVGYIMYEFLKKNSGVHLQPVCLDVLPKHVRLVRQRQKEHNVNDLLPIVGNAEHIPLSDNFVNAVLCSEVMEHVPNPEDCCREVFRIVAPGGRVVVSTPNRIPYERYNSVRLAIRKLLRMEPGPSEDFYDSPLEHTNLIEYLEKAGFEIEEVVFGIKVPFAKRFFMYLPGRLAMGMVMLLEKILPDVSTAVSILIKCKKPDTGAI